MKLNCQGLEISIELRRPDNEGWMSTDVRIQVPSMSSKFQCTIERQEWQEFINALNRLQAKIGQSYSESWGNMEENMEFTFTLVERGALFGSYRFSPNNFSLGPVLSGSFEADQTFVHTWATAAVESIAHER